MSKHRNKNKRKELLELFDLATVNPKLAKELIEVQIDQPYTRSLASNITRDNILNFADYHIQNHYQNVLYQIWNYADNEGYAVTCSKCNSTNIQINYKKTTFNMNNKETNTPINCLDCGYETVEEK